MMHHSDDALDAALFALPLEEPPADLRASILTATVYRPAPAFALWEVALLAIATAVLAWLVALVAQGGLSLFAHTVSVIGLTVGRSLSNVTTLAWIAAGGAAAFWISIFTASQPATIRVHGKNGNSAARL